MMGTGGWEVNSRLEIWLLVGFEYTLLTLDQSQTLWFYFHQI